MNKEEPVARVDDGRRELTMSAGLLKIFKVGTLIMGDSGIGKSESSLELVARGHVFISDDVVRVIRPSAGTLIGRAPDLSRNFMEIRGLGIINIKEIFGNRAVSAAARINLIIKLMKWRRGFEVDRLGLGREDSMRIMDEKVPILSIPVAPGRNIATLIEVACRVHLLRRAGYHAPSEFVGRVNKALR